MHKLLQLYRRVSPLPYRGISMSMSNIQNLNRIVRLPGEQGARPSAGNQAGVEKLTTGNRSHGKRTRTSSGSSDETVSLTTPLRPWIKFFLVSSNSDQFKRLSAITVCKSLQKCVGETESTKRQQDGSLLIHACNSNQADKIQHLTRLAGVPVNVTPHKSLNSCKGVVYSHESGLCSDDELKDWLSEQGVTDFHRIPTKSAPCELLILTFAGTILPNRVSVGFEWCRVRPYIPNPRRCFHCQRFGHVSKYCKRQAACANCASLTHTHSRDDRCSLPAHCVNCGAAHAAFDKKCPKWNLEKEVLRLRSTQNISFPQARRLVESSNGPITYASVASYPAPTVRTTPRPKVVLDPNYTYSTRRSLTPPRMYVHASTTEKLASGISSSPSRVTIPMNDLPSIPVHASATSAVAPPVISSYPSQDTVPMDELPVSIDVEAMLENSSAASCSSPDISTVNIETASIDDSDSLSTSQFLMYVLHNSTDDFSLDRAAFVECHLTSTLELLKSNKLTRAHRCLSRRSTMTYRTWPSDELTPITDLQRVIEPYQFSDEHYCALVTLVLHDMLAIALRLAKQWRTLAHA